MKLISLNRFENNEDFVIGNVDFFGKKYLSLEDADRGLTDEMSIEDILKIKIPEKTAIPTGLYKVVIDYSNRFKQLMPHLLNVKGFEGVRIHWGSYAKNTEGCPLFGTIRIKNGIAGTRDAFKEYFPLLEEALKTEEVFIQITTSTIT